MHLMYLKYPVQNKAMEVKKFRSSPNSVLQKWAHIYYTFNFATVKRQLSKHCSQNIQKSIQQKDSSFLAHFGILLSVNIQKNVGHCFSKAFSMLCNLVNVSFQGGELTAAVQYCLCPNQYGRCKKCHFSIIDEYSWIHG